MTGRVLRRAGEVALVQLASAPEPFAVVLGSEPIDYYTDGQEALMAWSEWAAGEVCPRCHRPVTTHTGTCGCDRPSGCKR